jgi:hypothetical protein
MHTKAIVEENIIEPGSTIDKVGTEVILSMVLQLA